jgi:hypothetical protein
MRQVGDSPHGRDIDPTSAVIDCLLVFVPIAVVLVFLFWIFVKGPLQFTTALLWAAASAGGASLAMWPVFARGSLQTVRKRYVAFVITGLIFLAAIVLFFSYGINDL